MKLTFIVLLCATASAVEQPVGSPGLAKTADGMTGVAPAHDRARTTPVEKVIQLLEKFSAQIQEEGKAEAAAYDKFACFCKEQADEKLYSITKAKERISMLTAHIESLEAEIAELDAETGKTRKAKSAVEEDNARAQEQRDSEFKEFQAEDADLRDAIDAIERAVAALEESKEGMVDAKLSLVKKLSKTVLRHLMAAKDVRASPRELKALYAFLETGAAGKPAFLQQPGKPHAYEYKSNDIIAILKGLLQTFKQKSRDRVSDEQNNKHDFDMSQQARTNQIKAYEALIAKNEEISAAKSDEKGVKEQDKEETTTAMGYDQEFLDELTVECEDKATAWDGRSKIRANELTAISEAIGLLKGTVSSTYGANKKLVGLVAKKVQKGLWFDADDDDADDDVEDVSFLQKRRRDPKRKALKYLSSMARNLKSATLSTLVLKLKEDHFVKVRSLVKDLIARLEAEAEAEASQKQWCDEEMASATEKRDDNQAKIEKQNAAITEGEAKVEKLAEDIKVLGEEIAELYKALNEATQLREDEHADNTMTISDASAGLEAVTAAIKVLRDFYDNPTGEFMQYEPFRAAGADASGKTVKDLAPETFEGDYAGKQQESEGIFGLLEIIKSDFERTVSTTEHTEAESESKFQTFKAETEKDIDAKKSEKDEKESTKKQTEADVVDFKDELKDATTLKGEALEELEKLKPACVDSGMSWKERTARREQEIEALKEALHILDTAFN